MTLTKQNDYPGVIDELVPSLFKGKPRLDAINEAFANRFQEIEDALWELVSERFVSNATGDALTKWGDLVGVAANGLDDDDFRRLINARILSNRSDGTGDLLLRVLNYLSDTDTAIYSPLYPAGMSFQVLLTEYLGPEYRNRLGSWMQGIAGAGIEIYSIAEYITGGFCFGIDETTPEIVGGGGLSEGSTVYMPDSFGGKWAEDWMGTTALTGRLTYFPSLRNGMVGSWEFDDNAANTTVAELFQNFTGTANVNTSTLSVAGKIDDAFDFNGTTEGVDLTAHIATIGAMSEGTISMWVKNTHDATLRTLFGVSRNATLNTEWSLCIQNGYCGVFAQESGSSVISFAGSKCNSQVANGGWTFVVVSVDATGMKWYLDSVLDLSLTSATYQKFFDQITNNSCNIARVARSFGAYNQHYAGSLDSIRLHSRALTQSEITNLYNGGSGLPW